MKYDLVVKDCDWLALKLGPILLDMLTMGSMEEADTYDYEEYVRCLIDFMEYMRDQFSRDFSGELGNPLLYKAVAEGAKQFLAIVKMVYC